MIDAAMRWQVRSEADVAAVYDALFDDIYRYAARIAGPDQAAAEDAVQEAFVSLVRAVRAGDVEEITVGWLHVAVRSRFIDHARRSRVAERTVMALRAARPAPEPADPAPVADAVARLDPLDRLVLLQHHVDGHPVADVATMIGRSLRATESILARARIAARRTMGGTDGRG
jgi:RNA polymerase sigma-70 factor, ECF subfamily